jgi:hypothetical protein
MNDVGTQLPSEMLLGLYGYWDRKRAGRRMPARADLDPIEIRDWMPSIIICEVEAEPLRFRYRLIGTRITELVHRDATGRYIDESLYGDNVEVVKGPFLEAYQTRAPVALRGRLKWGNVEREVAALSLPLSNDGETVNMVMFCVDVGDLNPLLPDGVPVMHRDLFKR